MAMLGKIVMTLLAFSSTAWPNNNNVNSNAPSLNKVGKLKSQKAATIWMLSNALWWPRPTPEGIRHAGDI
jgi:hypothetical protein